VKINQGRYFRGRAGDDACAEIPALSRDRAADQNNGNLAILYLFRHKPLATELVSAKFEAVCKIIRRYIKRGFCFLASEDNVLRTAHQDQRRPHFGQVCLTVKQIALSDQELLYRAQEDT